MREGKKWLPFFGLRPAAPRTIRRMRVFFSGVCFESIVRAVGGTVCIHILRYINVQIYVKIVLQERERERERKNENKKRARVCVCV